MQRPRYPERGEGKTRSWVALAPGFSLVPNCASNFSLTGTIMSNLNERQSFETLIRVIHEAKMERAMVQALASDKPTNRLSRTTYVYDHDGFYANKTITRYSENFYKIDEEYELKK